MMKQEYVDRVTALINTIPQQTQVQFAFCDQAKILLMAANRLGLYDVADVVQDMISPVSPVIPNPDESIPF